MTSCQIEPQYLSLLAEILADGHVRDDRTGVGTRSVFGRLLRHDLASGLPLLTTKKLHFRSIVGELLWFLRGDDSIAYLRQNGISIWDEWASETGELGPVYGVQWRRWPGPNGERVDQVAHLLKNLRERPYSRRHVISAWNVADLPDESLSAQANVALGKMALAPCHVMYQFWVKEGRLSCLLTQRSADVFLGLPYNLASAALLTELVARYSGLLPGELVHSLGDVHLYQNHIEQARLQLTRSVRPLPQLRLLATRSSLFDHEIADFALDGYDPHPPIAAPIAV